MTVYFSITYLHKHGTPMNMSASLPRLTSPASLPLSSLSMESSVIEILQGELNVDSIKQFERAAVFINYINSFQLFEIRHYILLQYTCHLIIKLIK